MTRLEFFKTFLVAEPDSEYDVQYIEAIIDIIITRIQSMPRGARAFSRNKVHPTEKSKIN